VLILNTINPQLKGLTALDGLTGVNVTLTGNQTDCSVQPMPPSCCAEGENYWIVGEIGFVQPLMMMSMNKYWMEN